MTPRKSPDNPAAPGGPSRLQLRTAGQWKEAPPDTKETDLLSLLIAVMIRTSVNMAEDKMVR